MVASRLLSAGLVDGSRCVALGLLNGKWLTVVDVCCRPASPWQLPCILAIVKASMGQPKQKHLGRLLLEMITYEMARQTTAYNILTIFFLVMGPSISNANASYKASTAG